MLGRVRTLNLAIEGNIGVGKSTLLGLIERRLQSVVVKPIQEPIVQWQDIQGDNLLDLFYQDPHRWAYTFQSYAFFSRLDLHRKVAAAQAEPGELPTLNLLERSVYSDRTIFAANCHAEGMFNQVEWQIYQSWHDKLIAEYKEYPVLDGFVYLRASPETCHKRLQKRARAEESVVPVSYLQQLHERHEAWLTVGGGLTTTEPSLPVLTIDCESNFYENKQQEDELIRAVDTFLEDLIRRQCQVTANL